MLPKKLTQLSDVYNYAASFGSTPKTTIRQFTTINHLNKIRTLVEFTIELSQQNIKAAAISEAFVSSLAGAVARFEQQVNDNEFTKSTVNGATTLTSKNARHFLEQHHKNTSFELDAVHVCPGPRTISYFRAVLLANGKEIAHPVLAKSRTEAVSLAYLAAAVTLRANERSLESGPSEPLKGSGRSALPPVLPTSTTLEEDCLLAMQGTIQEMRETGFPDDANQYQPDMVPLEERRRTRRYELTEERAHSQSRRLRWMLRMFRRDPRLKDLRDKLSALPMNRYRTQVINMVEKNNYSVIIGATGSGKTTQVPQILLNHAVREGRGAHCNIICTQPRRIAASSVARRVAEERDQQLRDSVGYHIRFDPQLPRAGGSITYCTTGILLVQLQHAPDEIFDSVSHIIVDEIHERDVDVDFLLILLKNVVKRRKRENKSVPKIILMSATIDPDLFADYFPNELPDGTLARCPSLSIPGRTFPVKHWYLEDLVQQFSTAYDAEEILPLLEERDTAAYLDDLEAKHEPQAEDSKAPRQSSGWDNVHDSSIDSQEATSRVRDDEPLVPLGLTCATIGHIARTSPEGAILVFLPGLGEIQRVQQMLMEQSPLGVDFSDSNKFRIFKLHSRIAATEKDVFASLPAGCRKIILSTNIAETSVTISDVQYVVDTGKLREKRYDQERRISKLACCWISKSNAKQRSGRAGRVQNGNYYALYTRQQFESFRAVGVPEMLRSDLQEICLRVKAQAFQTRIRDFLAQALEPPSLTQVDSTVTNLQTLEALDQNEEITALGRLLAQLPVHPSQGKMIVLGIIFRCLDPMIIMSSIGSEGLLWNLGIGEERAAAAKSRAEYVYESNSEHIGIINAFKDARNVLRTAGNDACRAHCEPRYVHFQSFRNILRTTRQIKDILEEKNLIPVDLSDGVELGGPDLNVNSSRIPLIKALLTSGMFPNIAVSTNRKGAFRTENEINAYLHFRNTLSAQSTTGKAPQGRRLIAFSSLEKAMQGDMLLLRDVQEITPLVAMLFGGRLTGKDDTVTMDSWLPFHIPHPGTSTHVPYQPAKMVIEFRKALDRVSADKSHPEFTAYPKLIFYF